MKKAWQAQDAHRCAIRPGISETLSYRYFALTKYSSSPLNPIAFVRLATLSSAGQHEVLTER
jgi:hypothetical protein